MKNIGIHSNINTNSNIPSLKRMESGSPNTNINININPQQQPSLYQYANVNANGRNSQNYDDYYTNYRSSPALSIHPPILTKNAYGSRIPTQTNVFTENGNSLPVNSNPNTQNINIHLNNTNNGLTGFGNNGGSSRPVSHDNTFGSTSSKYNFSKNIDRSSLNKNMKSKPKSAYKYNFFSSIDHMINTECKKGCGENQIIARKPTSLLNR